MSDDNPTRPDTPIARRSSQSIPKPEICPTCNGITTTSCSTCRDQRATYDLATIQAWRTIHALHDSSPPSK